MSTELTGMRDRPDPPSVPGGKPSLMEIARGFGVMIGPSLLLDLLVGAGTLAVLTGWLSRPREGLARLLRPLAILGAVLPWIYGFAIRPWHLRWGATDEEVSKPLPGDELAPDPAIESTRAITVRAPVDEVWLWLAQIGQDRGGSTVTSGWRTRSAAECATPSTYIPNSSTGRWGRPCGCIPPMGSR